MCRARQVHPELNYLSISVPQSPSWQVHFSGNNADILLGICRIPMLDLHRSYNVGIMTITNLQLSFPKSRCPDLFINMLSSDAGVIDLILCC